MVDETNETKDFEGNEVAYERISLSDGSGLTCEIGIDNKCNIPPECPNAPCQPQYVNKYGHRISFKGISFNNTLGEFSSVQPRSDIKFWVSMLVTVTGGETNPFFNNYTIKKTTDFYPVSDYDIIPNVGSSFDPNAEFFLFKWSTVSGMLNGPLVTEISGPIIKDDNNNELTLIEVFEFDWNNIQFDVAPIATGLRYPFKSKIRDVEALQERAILNLGNLSDELGYHFEDKGNNYTYLYESELFYSLRHNFTGLAYDAYVFTISVSSADKFNGVYFEQQSSLTSLVGISKAFLNSCSYNPYQQSIPPQITLDAYDSNSMFLLDAESEHRQIIKEFNYDLIRNYLLNNIIPPITLRPIRWVSNGLKTFCFWKAVTSDLLWSVALEATLYETALDSDNYLVDITVRVDFTGRLSSGNPRGTQSISMVSVLHPVNFSNKLYISDYMEYEYIKAQQTQPGDEYFAIESTHEQFNVGDTNLNSGFDYPGSLPTGLVTGVLVPKNKITYMDDQNIKDVRIADFDWLVSQAPKLDMKTSAWPLATPIQEFHTPTKSGFAPGTYGVQGYFNVRVYDGYVIAPRNVDVKDGDLIQAGWDFATEMHGPSTRSMDFIDLNLSGEQLFDYTFLKYAHPPLIYVNKDFAYKIT